MSSIAEIHLLGQSLWYDNIHRQLLESGEFEKMVLRGDIRGVTSNPSIFHNAIAKSTDYDTALTPMAWAGWNAEQIFDQLAFEDIQAAADLLLPLYNETGGGDGYVSLEVNPLLANSTEETVREARRLWQRADRPNLMIKIPATAEGIPAITRVIAEGINVNITLIFSLTRYAEVMEAYLRGLEERLDNDLPIDQVASVASFFVSRVDTKVDQFLEEIIQKEGPMAEQAAALAGKAAVANAKMAYANFRETFSSPRFERLRQKGARLQRPLWASTSTKNPAYRDVKYVEELIGPDTVNTLPPQTLDAFRDHGVAENALDLSVDEARQAITQLEALGISMDQVTAELEVEGVKAFSDAFSALLSAIEDRAEAARSQLGPLKEAVAHRIQAMEGNGTVQRMFAKDPNLWTDNSKEHAEIRNRLGWLDLPNTSLFLMGDITRFMEKCVKDGFTHALLLGMGGSSLAPEVLQRIFADYPNEKIKPGLHLEILDSTDPEQVHATALRFPIRQTLFIVSSKSGTTSEVNAFLAYFFEKVQKKVGQQAGEHFIAITDPGTPLERLAGERGFCQVFVGDPDVGGRYSALTAFGLVPAGLIGLDLARLLFHANTMAKQCTPTIPAGRNPGLVLGAVLGEAALQGRDKLTFLADPQWSSLGTWLEQLIAESSGKNGRGIVPIEDEPIGTPDQYQDDRLFVYLKSSGRLADTAVGLLRSGHPVITLTSQDPYDIGAEFYRWEFATAIACAVLGVNAFDQPDVQDNKSRTTQMIKTYQQRGRFEQEEVIWENAQGIVSGKPFPGLDQAKSLAEVVRSFLSLKKQGDYIALNAYLPRDSETLVKLRKLRQAIRDRTHLATTIGFGPRFLHSTGQLHKGGANNGLFIQITRDPEEDVSIPGDEITFGVLERAQALGDLEALLARGRRVIRIHLTSADIEDLIWQVDNARSSK